VRGVREAQIEFDGHDAVRRPSPCLSRHQPCIPRKTFPGQCLSHC
jgi:hypothetical protein